MIDRRAEIRRRTRLPGYLDKLGHLMGYRPDIGEICSPEAVRQLQNELTKYTSSAAPATKVILFSERLSSWFAALVANLECQNPNPVFVWIDATNDCGFARPIKLRDFRFDFQFECIPEGVVALITADARDKMLLDFERDQDGAEIMTIELTGAGWGKAELL